MRQISEIYKGYAARNDESEDTVGSFRHCMHYAQVFLINVPYFLFYFSILSEFVKDFSLELSYLLGCVATLRFEIIIIIVNVITRDLCKQIIGIKFNYF